MNLLPAPNLQALECCFLVQHAEAPADTNLAAALNSSTVIWPEAVGAQAHSATPSRVSHGISIPNHPNHTDGA